MPVRKTESRIPQIAGFTIADLGESAVSGTNAAVKLVSYLSSPVGVNILQNYVVFVEDAILAPNVASYDWVFNNNAPSAPINSINGVKDFRPSAVGTLSVTVNLKDAANTVLHSVVLQQQVSELNLELEQLIDQEGSRSPSAGNPTLSKDVINGLRIFVDNNAHPSTENGLNRLILSMIYANISANTPTARNTLLENCSAAIQTSIDTFFTTAQNGIGITKLRPHIACMYLIEAGNPLIAITELPLAATATQLRTALTTMKTAFNGLSEPNKIDIFNLLRFPKSNIKICKMVLAGLQGRTYFSGQTFPSILSARTTARRLITEYEKGPYVPPAATSTRDLSTSSTAVFNFMMLPVWRISVSALTNPSGTIDPQSRLFGVPEAIPEKTFMAASGMFPGDAPFLTSGQAYHTNFNISFSSITSLQEIINSLQADSTIFNHMRIFTHANEDLLGISLFQNGAGFVTSRHLDGFKISEIEGVIGILSMYFSNGFIYGIDRADLFLDHLRINNSTALTAFGLQPVVSPAIPTALSVDLRHLFRRYIDIWLVKIPGAIQPFTGTAPTTTNRNLTSTEINNTFIPFLNIIIRLLEAKITTATPALTPANFTLLRNAILAITPINLGFAAGTVPYNWTFPNNPSPNNFFAVLIKDLNSTVAALPAGNTFMTKLQHVKNERFNTTSSIDIRGCLAGKLPALKAPPPPLLVSIQNFFGKTGSLPKVNAPEWFQSFDSIYTHVPLSNNIDIDNIFTSGFTGGGITLSALEVTNDFATWSQLSNIDGQFTFFTTLFSATTNIIDFASLRWRTWQLNGSTTGIPPLHLYSVKVDDMVQLPLGDIINRLKENFAIAGSNLSATIVTKLNTLQPKIEELKIIEEQLAVFSGADFSSFYNSLHALEPLILGIAGMPVTATPLTDAAMPATLNSIVITSYITNFKTYLTNALTTDIGSIVSSIRTAIAIPNAKAYYYFKIGLPLRAQTTSGNSTHFVIFHDASMLSDAIKSYMKCQWTGTPSQIADMHAFINTRTINIGNGSTFLPTAILVETETSATPNAVAPLPAYFSHIIST